VLKGLVDLYDALSLAGREVGRIREAVLPTLDQLANAAAPEPPPLPPEPLPAPPAAAVETATAPAPAWWQRWLSRNPEAAAPTPAPPADAWPRHAAALRELLLAERRMAAERLEPARAAARQARQWLDGVLAGYAMSLQRVERALLQEGLEPIAATGRPFDPEQMEAVEIVTATDRPAGEVLAELRRGYLWKGGVFRYAQVSVAKPVG
jgi:molecular chaperone GrpE